MEKAKIAGIILAGTLVITGVKFGYDSAFAMTTKPKVTLLDYSAQAPTNKPFSVKINSLHNLQGLDYLSQNEILTLNDTMSPADEKNAIDEMNKKADEQLKAAMAKDKNAKVVMTKVSGINSSYYFSIYNTVTGKTKDFKNTNVADFINVSPDKKYVIYEEPKEIPTGDQWQKDCDSGKLFNHSVKLLDLQTGEVTDLKTKYKNKETNYSWIGNDKLLLFYPNEGNQWEIEDLSGKIYKSGTFNQTSKDCDSWNAFNLNTTASDGKVNGSFMIQQYDPSVPGVTLKSTFYAVDVSSNTNKQIYRSQGCAWYRAQNKVILISDTYDTKEGRKTKLIWFDENGNKKGEHEFNDLVDADKCSISNDGSKIAFFENKVCSTEFSLNVWDLKSDKINKAYEGNTVFVGNGVDNLSWNSTGTALLLNRVNDKEIRTTDTYTIEIQ